MARPKAALVVTKVDRQVLDSMAHRARTAPQLARRARIVLACATGLDNTTVAKKLRMSKPTVGRWRQRFIDKGGDGLLVWRQVLLPLNVNYSCRFGRLLVRRRTVRWALLRVLKTLKTKQRERPLGDVHGVR